ncbi:MULTISPECIES: hypothetical protein [unclassified Streptomyces]|uniref:hypothetical protein n=1 Tax=unclassified Streptomyces TaxID=2593676 RepID=UPI00037A51E1|nr:MULTISPECIES: hypothetical protein [unclassified Streptomyces]MYY03109.1 hypothetical protein [Streptomyces sp. SID4913]
MDQPTTHLNLSIPARMIRRGDEFTLHRRTRVAAGSPGVGEYGSAVVPLEGGGAAWLSKDAFIDVRRPVRNTPCATA